MQRAFNNPDASTNRELELLIPHAEFLAATDRLSPEGLGDLLSFVGRHHQTMGRFTAARHAFSRTLVSDKKSFEPGHPSIARSQSNLALVLKDLGQLEEARDLLRQALVSDEKSFEPGHPSIAIRQSNLATVLKDLGELKEARDLLRQAYSASLKRYGADHPHTKTFKSNLEGLPER